MRRLARDMEGPDVRWRVIRCATGLVCVGSDLERPSGIVIDGVAASFAESAGTVRRGGAGLRTQCRPDTFRTPASAAGLIAVRARVSNCGARLSLRCGRRCNVRCAAEGESRGVLQLPRCAPTFAGGEDVQEKRPGARQVIRRPSLDSAMPVCQLQPPDGGLSCAPARTDG